MYSLVNVFIYCLCNVNNILFQQTCNLHPAILCCCGSLSLLFLTTTLSTLFNLFTLFTLFTKPFTILTLNVCDQFCTTSSTSILLSVTHNACTCLAFKYAAVQMPPTHILMTLGAFPVICGIPPSVAAALKLKSYRSLPPANHKEKVSCVCSACRSVHDRRPRTAPVIVTVSVTAVRALSEWPSQGL